MKTTCTNCGAPCSGENKFCTSCGARIFSQIVQTNVCQCGSGFENGKKFCTACGMKNPDYNEKSSSITEASSQVKCTICGKENLHSSKFCIFCGQPMQKPDTSALETKVINDIQKSHVKPSHKKARAMTLIIIATTILAVAATYFFFFYDQGMKKTLIASFTILPNDTTETIIQHNDELTLIIPKGQVKQADTLDLYAVRNIKKPEFADKVIKTFDFDFRKTKSFDNEVKVIFNFQQEQQRSEFKPGCVPYIMYYNEETAQWEDTDVIIDKQNNTLTVYRTHFSSLGMVSAHTEPGPMMKALAMVDPSTILSPPDFSEAEKTMRYYITHKTAPAEAEIDGIDLFMKSYDVTTLSAGVHEDILKYPTFSALNKIAGKLGLVRAFVTFGIETGRKQYLDAVMNLSKELLTYGLAAAGWKVVAVYSVANFLYGLHKEHQAEVEQAAIQQDYLNKYYSYNANQNPYSKTVKGWSMFIQENIETHVDFEWALSQEINNYLNAYFNEHQVPDHIRENIIKQERKRMNEVIISAFDDYRSELRKQQEMEIIRDLSEMKKQMNTVVQIRVRVYGSTVESKAVRGLPVRIVVDKDQHLWEGVTDKGGQWWFNCTNLGYLYYGGPTVVELEYDGKVFTQEFLIQKSSVDVRFYIEEKQKETESANPVSSGKSNFDFDISGTYKGSYKSYQVNVPECMIDGTIEINIDDQGNAFLFARGKGGCSFLTYSTIETQTFDMSGSNPSWNKQENSYRISMFGSEEKTTTTKNEWETNTRTNAWDDRNISILIDKDGTIKNAGKDYTYLKFSIVKTSR